MITSGVFSCKRLRRRLFRLITRRYKSFKSLVAKRPPSSGTKGRKSGGITGSTSRIIHSGRVFDSINPLNTLRRLESFFFTCLERVACICSCNSSTTGSSSILESTSRTASAPILATKASSPYSSWACKYSCSVSNCFSSRGVLPGSITK